MKHNGLIAALTSCFLLVVLLSAREAFGQTQLPVPRASQKAVVSQTIGLTDVTITYHRPGVKNRKIWGDLVPYGEVWRAGANENTTISFNDPVKIESQALGEGTYGLHMIPTENEWTVIFSKNASSWGSFFYDEKEDALRVKVKAQPAEHQEWLSYQVDELTSSSGIVSLRWEKLNVPIKIDLDRHNIVLTHARDEYLRGPAGFSWQGWNQAANYCLQNNINLEEAVTWADKSISMSEQFANLQTKAGLLEKIGKTADARPLKDRSMKIANEADINNLGYQHLSANRTKEAIDLFKKNVKAYPDSWNVYDSLGEAYEKNGDMKLAVENYSQALKRVKDEQNKKRITQTLNRLQTK